MSGDNQGAGRKPTWKAGGSGPARQGPRHAWKPTEAPADRRPKRRLKQAAIGLGALACIAGIVLLWYILQRPPHAGLVLIGADPAEDVDRLDVPLDAYGWQGDRQIATWVADIAAQHKSSWGALTPEVIAGPKGGDGPVSLHPQEFADFAERLAKDTKIDPLVVVFGLHGAAGPEGPYLFTAGGGRLALREVIDTFAGKRFSGRKIVLVLDPARLTADPQLGLLHNDCVRSLKEMEPAIKDAASQLVVMCASGPGERSWDSEEWRCGAFTRALLDGLRGGATASHGNSVTLWDLFDYAKQQTETWTATNRPVRQTPVLLPELDGVGRDRARNIDVAVRVGSGVSGDPKDAPGAHFKASDDLQKRWQEWQKLDQSAPSPAVYTPRQWRRYRELLLRYEQLVRADESAAAGKLSQVLRNVSQELEDSLALMRDPASQANALPLPAALGLADVTAGVTQEPKFRDLWDARKKPEVEQTWLTMRNQAGASAETLRLRLTAYLLQQAGDPRGAMGDATDAAELLSLIYNKTDPAATRPAEAHYLLMLRDFNRDAALGWGEKRPEDNLLKQAVAVRQLAERAALGLRPADAASGYPYSEQVWPTVRAAVETADRQRRSAEDLLFTNPERWAASPGQLQTADTAYKRALDETARLLQEALATRDRALADLPFLTRWVAEQRADEARPADVVALWDKVHELDAKLNDLARRPDDAPAPNLLPLADATAAVSVPLQALTDKFQQQCRAAVDFPILQSNWRRIEQVLTVPLIEAGLRVRLVARSREMSAKFNEEKSGLTEGAAEEPARARAQGQGRLALAVLGNALLDAQSNSELRKAGALSDQLNDLGSAWEKEADRVGDQIGRHWKALADATDEPRSRAALAFMTPKEDPALAERRQRWQRLLVGLARRAFLDHWYAENGDAYYRKAAENFLKDADTLAPASADGRKQEVAGATTVRDLLKTPKLTLTVPEPFAWTDYPNRTLTYRVAAAPALQGDGLVALWPVVPTGAMTARPTDTRREPMDVSAAERTVRLDMPGTATAAPPVTLTLAAYYRGQKPRGETLISLDRTPVRVVSNYLAPRNSSGIAVRADPTFKGAVALVIDYSGSMGALPGKDAVDPDDYKNPKSKFQQMLQALPIVLRDIPAGTHLSVRVYGHKEVRGDPPAGANQNQRYAFWTKLTQDERIFNDVVTWGPDNTQQLDKLLTQLKSYKPQGYTPLVHTMKEAKAKDFPEKFDGPRTLLVLTDGADTWYGETDPQNRAKGEFEDAFRDADITVQMVLFTLDAAEEKNAKEQFDGVFRFRPLPGALETAKDANALAKKLIEGIRPKLRVLTVSGEPVTGVPPTGLPADKASDRLKDLNPSGPVAPGLYDGFVYRSPQPMRLARGDRLLVRLFNASNGVRFERDLLAKEWPLERRKEEGEWVLSVPRDFDDRTSRGRQLTLMTTLETTRGLVPGRDGVLQQTTPRSVWWEVTPIDPAAPKPGQLHVRPLYGYPAPAWDVNVEDWPADKAPRVEVWCRAEPPSVAKRESMALGDTREVEIDGQKLTLSVALERHPLPTAPGAEVAVDCVVVRVQHAAAGHPVMVQLAEVPSLPRPDAEEHRYFGMLNYTALFGPLTLDQVQGKRLEVELVTVASLKADIKPISLDLPAPRNEPQPQPLKLVGER